MVTNPSDYVEPFGKAGASGFTFHIEVARGKHAFVGKRCILF
jgi:ribulose-phosphate 3-epimerase